MLLKVKVYSYLCNVYSGRRMERLLQENVNYMWLSGMSRPDFRTINRFRAGVWRTDGLTGCSEQVVLLLNAEGLVSLKVQYIDGDEDRVGCEQVHFRMERECREEQGETGG